MRDFLGLCWCGNKGAAGAREICMPSFDGNTLYMLTMTTEFELQKSAPHLSQPLTSKRDRRSPKTMFGTYIHAAASRMSAPKSTHSQESLPSFEALEIADEAVHYTRFKRAMEIRYWI